MLKYMKYNFTNLNKNDYKVLEIILFIGVFSNIGLIFDKY